MHEQNYVDMCIRVARVATFSMTRDALFCKY